MKMCVFRWQIKLITKAERREKVKEFVANDY